MSQDKTVIGSFELSLHQVGDDKFCKYSEDLTSPINGFIYFFCLLDDLLFHSNQPEIFLRSDFETDILFHTFNFGNEDEIDNLTDPYFIIKSKLFVHKQLLFWKMRNVWTIENVFYQNRSIIDYPSADNIIDLLSIILDKTSDDFNDTSSHIMVKHFHTYINAIRLVFVKHLKYPEDGFPYTISHLLREKFLPSFQ